MQVRYVFESSVDVEIHDVREQGILLVFVPRDNLARPESPYNGVYIDKHKTVIVHEDHIAIES